MRARQGGALTTFMSMPKATVHENDASTAGKDNIGCTGQILEMSPIPISGPPQRSSDNQLGGRIFLPYPRHQTTALRRRKVIYHL
jgi:hypothetical protein